MFHSKRDTRLRCLIALVAIILGAAALAPSLEAEDWSTLFTAQDVRDQLSTPEGRAKALGFCRRMGLSKVYLEEFRDGYQADAKTLRTARDEFRQAGLKVSGCVTTTGLGKPSTGWKVAACYTNQANREHLASIFKFAASLFDEIMIDDFFFTDCACSECAAARGSMSWPQYREQLMLDVARQDVLGPAREANPNVKIILKFPQWYDEFQNRGYSPARESALFDRVWTGTELRDPSSNEWGHKEQYEGFFLFRWLTDVAGAKNGGGWFDPFGTTPAFYLDQAYVTALAGAPEVMLFHYGSLISPAYQAQADALAAHHQELDSLSKLVGDWRGIPAYKPTSSDPGSEPYVFDQIGMLGIPLLPVSRFPQGARAAVFTTHGLKDPQFVPELAQFLKDGGTAFITEPLAHRLEGDPRLPQSEALEPEKGAYLKTTEIGGGSVTVFSAALLKLTYVNAEDQVEQPTPEMSQAIEALRQLVANFSPTLRSAPVRVAVFPMGGRAAVVNFTELPVACKLIGLHPHAYRFSQVFATAGAFLDSDHNTLRLPPHGLLVVE